MKKNKVKKIWRFEKAKGWGISKFVYRAIVTKDGQDYLIDYRSGGGGMNCFYIPAEARAARLPKGKKVSELKNADFYRVNWCFEEGEWDTEHTLCDVKAPTPRLMKMAIKDFLRSNLA